MKNKVGYRFANYSIKDCKNFIHEVKERKASREKKGARQTDRESYCFQTYTKIFKKAFNNVAVKIKKRIQKEKFQFQLQNDSHCHEMNLK